MLLDVLIKNIWGLAITGGIQGTSGKRIYDELGLYLLVKRRWRNKLVFFYEIINPLPPD